MAGVNSAAENACWNIIAKDIMVTIGYRPVLVTVDHVCNFGEAQRESKIHSRLRDQ